MSGLSSCSLRPQVINEASPSTSAHSNQWSFCTSFDRRNRRSGHRCRAVHDSRHPDFNMYIGALPPLPADYKPGVVPGARTVATPLLTTRKLYDMLYDGVHDTARGHYGAFYSSVLGGVVTHPSFMVMHLDDHMAHRGHAVCDSVQITNGHLYRLPEHILRLVDAAREVGIELELAPETIMGIVLDTAAASRKLNGTVKVWITAGRGGFGVSNAECVEPGLYAMVTDDSKRPDVKVGAKACISPIPPHHASIAVLNTNNELPHVLAQMEAESRGYDMALIRDDSGKVVSATDMNLGFIAKDGNMVIPPPVKFAPSFAMQRLIDLVRFMDVASASKELKSIKQIEVREFIIDDMLAAKEVFGVNCESGVRAITSIDGKKVGRGDVGPTVRALQALLNQDMDPKDGASSNHIPVPYGYTSGR